MQHVHTDCPKSQVKSKHAMDYCDATDPSLDFLAVQPIACKRQHNSQYNCRVKKIKYDLQLYDFNESFSSSLIKVLVSNTVSLI